MIKIVRLSIMTILVITSINSTYAQEYPIPKESTLYKLQGVWTSTPEEDRQYEYFITKDYKSFSFIKYNDDELEVTLLIKGFQNKYKNSPDFFNNCPNEEFPIDSLKADGRYYTSFFIEDVDFKRRIGKLPFINSYMWEEGDFATGNALDIFFSNYAKPPYTMKLFKPTIWQDLYKLTKKDSRDYVLEFLDLDVREVQIETELYDNLSPRVLMKLKKGDIAEVKYTDKQWAYIEYSTDDKEIIKGHVKIDAINYKAPIPSFDPSKATTKIEKAICSDVVLASLDRQMLQAYKAAKKENPEKIKSEQKAWLKKRNSECKTKSEVELIQCLKDLYRKRLEELK